MKSSSRGGVFSVAMTVLGLGGAVYSAIEWMHSSSSTSTRYEILFVMWLVLAVGWGSKLLANGPRESKKQ